ncbi:MAG: hydrogenase nickel incorporation protein HypB [bacterium]|nr:hydrogenase nickel incorporation protein HypB [bacterium]
MRKITVMERVLAADDAWARENRRLLAARGARMYELVGSPGAGKTALLERTILLLGGRPRVGVIEGDLATARDAERIRRAGVPVVQINTGSGCHLSAHAVHAALADLLSGRRLDLVFVENVGNLVCPAAFDLGEDAKIALVSVTEGDDKVEKYPLLFARARALVLTKTALLPHTDFRPAAAVRAFRKLNRGSPVFAVDSLAGSGLDPWIAFVRGGRPARGKARRPPRRSGAAGPRGS